MQEHEYIYEHGLAQVQQDAEQAPVPDRDPRETEQARVEEQGKQGATSESAIQAEIMEELRDRRATLRMGRGLTVALVVSFLACLAALWLSSTLLGAPTRVLPVDFLQMLAANRVPLLCVPAVALVICYFALRSLTREILVGPVSRLDERQKILRDQAQRSAFKIIKFASLLVPVGFVLPHLPWFSSPSPVGFPLAVVPVGRVSVFNADGRPASGMVWDYHAVVLRSVFYQPMSFIQPASGAEIALAAGVLLICTLVLFSALPMAVLAWKGKA